MFCVLVPAVYCSCLLSTQFAQAYHFRSKASPSKLEEEREEGVSSSTGVQPQVNTDDFSHPKASYLEDANSHWGCRIAR